MIVATAGHIDHGKTTLVRALTGVDTDRLPQEKARGISIDLGFAYWHLPELAQPIGFVDVPGHERFIHNMLAGVCAIDLVLLVVAADDGVMPQTLEHLHIVELLGVRRGLVAISKADRVEPQRLDEVRRSLRERLRDGPLAEAPMLAVSAPTGAGMAILREQLLQAARACAADRRPRPELALRYAVDRAFVVAGSGTVVTGTVLQGAVAVGDRVCISPAGSSARVRGLRIERSAHERAEAGQRCALNLAGVEPGAVRRGDWLLDPALHAPTDLLDVELRPLTGEGDTLRHGRAVQLHLGTAEVTAHLAVPRGASIGAGQAQTVRLRLQRSIVAQHGDRCIVRDAAARRTLGGGIVIDPQPPRRRSAQRGEQLAALRQEDAGAALGALSGCSPQGIDLAAFGRAFGLRESAREPLAQACALVSIGRERPRAYPDRVVDEVAARVDAALRVFHVEQPRSQGMDTTRLRAACAPAWNAETFASALRLLAPRLELELKGSTVRSARHATPLAGADEALWQRVQPPLDAAGYAGLSVGELASRLDAKELVLRDLLHHRAARREGAFATTERFYTRRVLLRLVEVAAEVASEQPGGCFTAAQVRDRIGVGRALTVQLLECLDRWGLTVRHDGTRTLRPAWRELAAETA